MTRAPLRLTGTPASPGLARGPAYLLDESVRTVAREHVSTADEEQHLRAALASAGAELAALIAAGADADAAEILEFQVAMLEDETIVEPACAAIAQGAPAGDAWRAVMEDQLRDYDAADDPYFRARASDLRDMRDRVLRRLAGAPAAAVPSGAIVIAADLPPSRFLEISWQRGGIALFDGSSNSHVATLARARGVPMIVGMAHAELTADEDVLLDADNGVLIAYPDSDAAREFGVREHAAERARLAEDAFLSGPARTARGERVKVLLNVADPAELDGFAVEHCDGIGLVRTELVLRSIADLHDEDRQYDIYRRIVAWAHGRPVTIRTLDAGGDKPIDGYTVPAESNPFLGLRGVRLSLLHPDVLKIQLRALARASAFGPVKIMVPMVTNPAELDEVRALLETSVRALRDEGTACEPPELGMMVEVPAAALTIERFAADFLSIGSNDLIAYLTASSRDSERLAPMQDPLQPAVLRVIRTIVQHARSVDVEVSLCGDMAGDVRCVPALLDAGLRSLSVAPAAVGRVKAAVGRFGEEIRG